MNDFLNDFPLLLHISLNKEPHIFCFLFFKSQHYQLTTTFFFIKKFYYFVLFFLVICIPSTALSIFTVWQLDLVNLIVVTTATKQLSRQSVFLEKNKQTKSIYYCSFDVSQWQQLLLFCIEFEWYYYSLLIINL